MKKKKLAEATITMPYKRYLERLEQAAQNMKAAILKKLEEV